MKNAAIRNLVLHLLSGYMLRYKTKNKTKHKRASCRTLTAHKTKD